MARLWCKALKHLFPDDPEEAEPTHTEVVDEARRATHDGKKQLAEARKLLVTMEKAADGARAARDRNHFSERVATMLREER